MSFHSTQATSHALQPIQIVVSISLQTSGSRCTSKPGEGPECPEICLICSVLRSLMLAVRSQLHYAFSIFTRNPLNSGVNAFGSTTVGVS